MEDVEPEFVNHADASKCWSVEPGFLALEGIILNFRPMDGPYAHFPFSAEIVKNRQLTEEIREILLKIHKKTLKFLANRLPILNQAKKFNKTCLLRVLREMCSTVFRIKNVKKKIVFPSDSLCAAVGSALNGTYDALQEGDVADFYQRMSTFLPEVSDTLRNDVATRLLTFFCHSGKDCLRLIAKAQPGSIHGFCRRSLRLSHDNLSFYKSSNVFHEFNRERGVPLSMWCSIPADSVPLVEHVFDYGLLEILPPPLVKHVSTWLTGVRDRMRIHLKSGEFQNFARQFKSGTVLEQNDTRIEQFVKEIARIVLNSQDFPIFDYNVEEFAWQTLQHGDVRIRLSDDSRYRNRLSPSVVRQLDALLGKRCHPQIRLHCLTQMLRFVTTFICHTIRCVFVFDRNLSKYEFDGSFEQGVIDDSISDTEDVMLGPASDEFLDSFAEAGEFFYNPAVVINPREPTSSSALNFATNPVITIPSAPVLLVEPSYREEKPIVAPDMSPDVIEVEPTRARTLQTPSEASGSIRRRLNRDDDVDDEERPRKWRRAYRDLLETTAELKYALEVINKRYDALF